MSNQQDTKRKALGRGLEALLPSRENTQIQPQKPETTGENQGKPREIAVELIDRNPFQTRGNFDADALRDLAQSIESNGVLQPILVRAVEGGRFQLIAGERRWRASQLAEKNTVPAIVRVVSDEQAMEMTIVENLQRADLNPMEQAKAYQRLSSDFGMTQEQMAKRTGKERASVANFLRLLKLPVEVQQKVELGELSFGHARTLLALEDKALILKASAKVLALAMSVRQTETYVQGLLNPEKKIGKSDAQVVEKEQDPNVREAQEQLQRTLGLKVKIEDKKGKGRVIIEYSGLEDFDALLEVLGRK